MNNEPLISIIIVNYNVKDFLVQCLKSIEKASKELVVEIIVIDNNSSDGSIEFLKNKFPYVKYIELKENVGFAKANNIGIGMAKGKYILILNPDTILEERTLLIMVDFMEKNPETGIAGCKVLNADGTFQLACRRGFPTPWASFSKLFGLQRLFPGIRFFSKYNQTFRSINETYNVDAVMGAFMFCRKNVLNQLKGFDEDFFMYGEDLDLCYRAAKIGWKTTYVHETSIIHYKGESTKRSSINEIKHFYDAMEIYARKHISNSVIFLKLLKIGIVFRSLIAIVNKYRREFFIIFYDLFAINLSLIVATKLRFGDYFNFPDYAYPTVFIVLSVVMFISMFASGEYFEGKMTVRRSVFGLMITFFIVSSLTYFFNEYAFSRGILLMTIGFTTILIIACRLGLSIYDKTRGREGDRRIAFVGTNSQTQNIVNALVSAETRNADIAGVITTGSDVKNDINIPVLGNLEYLGKIIEEYKLHEIIITDRKITESDFLKIASELSGKNVRFHIAGEFEELTAARIISEITGFETTFPKYRMLDIRIKLIKRFTDIFLALFFLSIGLPVSLIIFKGNNQMFKDLKDILIGKKWFIGLYPTVEKLNNGKLGIIGLAHISKPERLSQQALINLNRYYLQNYSLSLDLDIFIKFIFRRK